MAEPARDSFPVAVDDATIVARVLDGDRQQFARLVERYQGRLHRHAVALVLDHDCASDMVQDAFIRAYTRLATCRHPERFRAWLLQLLRNRCLDHLKDIRRKQVRLDDAGGIIDAAEGPHAQMERAGLRREIREALSKLSDAQREAFLMHYMQGMPYEEMAGLLDASESALKMRVLRARAILALALRGDEVTQPRPVRLSIEHR